MGIWGSSFYDNDTAADIRDAFCDLSANGIDVSEIYKRIVAEYADMLLDPEEGPLAMLALYDQLLENGALEELEREAALEIIRTVELPVFKHENTPEHTSERTIELARLREKFQSATPKKKSRKRCTSKRPIPKMQWKVGQLYAIPIMTAEANTLHIGGEYILLYVNGYRFDDIADIHFWVKLTRDGVLPKTEAAFNRLPFVQIGATLLRDRFGPFSCYEELPKWFQQDYRPDAWGELPEFTLKIYDARRVRLPKGVLFLGQFNDTDVVGPANEYFCYPFPEGIFWNDAEEFILKRYRIFTLKNAARYKA